MVLAADAAWMLFAVLWTAVFLFGWSREGLRRGWLASLLFGKLLAGVYHFAGLDVPVYRVVLACCSFTVTRAELVFLLFLATLAGSVLFYVYGRWLPEELREVWSGGEG